MSRTTKPLIRAAALTIVVLSSVLPSFAGAQWFRGPRREPRGEAPAVPTLPSGPPAILEPDWLSQPSAADIARAYPARARAAKEQGLATLSCTVREDGRLAMCLAAHEYPAGFGFGAAAMSLVPKFCMKPVARDGTPTAERTVKVVVQFQGS